jgi:hypothetical protein
MGMPRLLRRSMKMLCRAWEKNLGNQPFCERKGMSD